MKHKKPNSMHSVEYLYYHMCLDLVDDVHWNYLIIFKNKQTDTHSFKKKQTKHDPNPYYQIM